ncbi:MAG: hypothetical protein JNM10_05185 [Planctomycetia bacterium]|nr:hypothetical protein [Planctomycetia bacterium]
MRGSLSRALMILGLVAGAGAVAWFVRSDLERDRAFRARLDAAMPRGEPREARPVPPPADATRLHVTVRDGATSDQWVVVVGGVVVEVPRAPGGPQDAAFARLTDVVRDATTGRVWAGASLVVEARDALSLAMRVMDALGTAGLRDLEMR